MLKTILSYIKKNYLQTGTILLPTTFMINWTSDMTNAMLADIQGIITDLSPLLVPIIAIGVGLIVVGAIISAIRGHS